MIITESEFLAWARSAKPKDSIIYYSGHLAKDKVDGRLALELAYGGTVLLVQKRHGKHQYDYIAIRSSQPEVKRGKVIWS